MKNVMSLSVFVLSLIVVPTPPLEAQGTTETIGTWGVGTQSCGSYLANFKTSETRQEHSLAVSWVQGYLTGAVLVAKWPGKEQGWTLRQTDVPALEAWLGMYCQQHPLEHLSYAAMKLIGELMVARQ